MPPRGITKSRRFIFCCNFNCLQLLQLLHSRVIEGEQFSSSNYNLSVLDCSKQYKYCTVSYNATLLSRKQTHSLSYPYNLENKYNGGANITRPRVFGEEGFAGDQ
jgi:hypothetical protein